MIASWFTIIFQILSIKNSGGEKKIMIYDVSSQFLTKTLQKVDINLSFLHNII